MAGSVMTGGTFDFGLDPESAPDAAPQQATPAANDASGGSFDFQAAPLAEPEPEPALESVLTPEEAEAQFETNRQLSLPQFDPSGIPVLGSEAERLGIKQHSTSAALQAFNNAEFLDGNDLGRAKLLADVLWKSHGSRMIQDDNGNMVKDYAVTPEMVMEMPQNRRDSLMQRQDFMVALERGSIVARRLLEDAEMLAILQNDLGILFAAEGAMVTAARLEEAMELGGGRVLTPLQEAMGVEPGDGSVGVVVGTLAAITRGSLRQEAVVDVGKAFAQIELGNDEAAVQLLLSAAESSRRSLLVPHSDLAKSLLEKMPELDVLDLGEGIIRAIELILKENPVEATAMITEIMAEQILPLGLSALTTAIATPAAGIGVMGAMTFAQEQFGFTPDAMDNIKEKFGYDLTTEAGIRDFVDDKDARSAFLEFGVKRAIPITAASFITAGIARALRGANVARLAKVGTVMVSEMAFEFTGESLAGIWSGTGFLLSESLLESLAGGHPVTVGLEMFTAGTYDFKERADAKAAREWLRSGEATAEAISGMPTEKLSTAAEALAAKLKAEGVETIYIPAEELQNFDQDGSATETLGLTSEAVAEAARNGQDVAIDAAAYIRHILGKEGFDALQRHTRFDVAGMTAAEAEVYESEGIGDEIRKRMQEVAEARIGSSLDDASLAKLHEDTEAIRQDVVSQLEATGVYTGGKADLFAQITAQRYAARAIRMTEETGQPVDALELFMADSFRIQGQAREQSAAALEQTLVEQAPDIAADSLLQSDDLQALNEVDDGPSLTVLTDSMRESGWVGPPLLVAGNQALTGSHRLSAARAAGVAVPVISIDEELYAAWLDSSEFDGEPDLTSGDDEQKLARFRSIGDARAVRLMEFEVRENDVRDLSAQADEQSAAALEQRAEDHTLANAQRLLKDDLVALGLTEEQAAKISPIYRPEVLPEERLPSNREAALWLEANFIGEPITDFTQELTPEQIDEISTIMAAEAQLALESTGSAFDWYSGALSRALGTMQVKYPMLADDASAKQSGFGTAANARFAFTYIMAVTSQNLDVAANGVATDKAFEEMVDRVRSGVFSMPRSWGTGDKQAAMGDNFDKFGPMVEAMPGEGFPEKLAALDALFRKKMTVKEWVAKMKAEGIPYNAPGQTAVDAVVYGSSTLGPKIGNGFWQNLNGNFSPLTIDLWMRRTWGRYTGKSIGNPAALPAQRARLQAAIKRSRSRQRGKPDHIEAAKANVTRLEWYIGQVVALPADAFPNKKDRTAELKRLRADLKVAKEIVPDLEGIKAPEPYKAAYNKDDAALVEYAKRVLAVWNSEYDALAKKHKGKVPADLQPTWARAAKTVITNLAKPLDQVANGTQRKQIEAAGAQALEKLAERGIDVTTADLQALLWYPEKDLWGALTTELETDTDNIAIIPPNPLNESYDTAFARILRSQGHAVEGAEGDQDGGGDGGAVARPDGRPEEPAGAVGPGPDSGRGAGGGAGTLEQSRAGAGGRGTQQLPGPRRAGEALEGVPEIEGATGPLSGLDAVVQKYAEDNGIPYSRQGAYVEVDEARAGRIAQAFEDMENNADAPGVREAYDDMIRQTLAQYAALTEAGYTFSFMDPNNDPYDGNGWNAMRDARENKHVAIFPTTAGFGTDADFDVSSNPMLAQTDILIPDAEGNMVPALANDIFRAVHDLLGHGIEGAGFRAQGEENAWQAHARLFTGPALGAVTTETRGQNSWLNYGPHGESNRTAKLEDTVFADQKIGLMPEWTWTEGVSPPQTLEQDTAAGPRGSFTPAGTITDQDGNPVNLIQIFEKADATTFLHESGHFWLEQLSADSLAVGGQFKKDFDAVTNWWGQNALNIKEEATRRANKKGDLAAVSRLQKMTEAQVKAYVKAGNLRGDRTAGNPEGWLSIAMHEQFARGTETYFASGKAPSIGLASAFNSFKVWIAGVYRRMRGMEITHFSTEVRDVMDRMLASDEEIAAANGQYAMAALLTTAEEAGMTKSQFEAYQEEVARSNQQSKANQLAKNLREINRAKTDEWNADREAKREEVTTEVANRRQYRLMYILTEGGLADGSIAQGLERIPPMDQKVLEQVLEDHGMTLADLPRVGSKGLYQKSKEAGDVSSPGAVAAVFEYADVTEMLTELLDTGDFNAAVEAELDARMKQEFGSMDDTGDQEAIASIHGDHTAKVLAAELAALRTTEPAFKAAFIRQYAIEQLAKMQVNDIKHHVFSAAEKRHARLAGRALRRGDRAEAYKHQFQRLVNHRMAAESLNARKDIEKKSRFMRDLQKQKKRPNMEAGYLASIQTLLEATDFRAPIGDKKRLRIELAAMAQFMEEAQENDGAVFNMPEWLLAKDSLINVRDMTYQEFLELHEAVKTLEQQGRLAKKLRLGQEDADRQTVLAQLQTRLAGRDLTMIAKIYENWGGTPTGGSAVAVNTLSFLASMNASLLRTEFLLEALDGAPLGPWHQSIYQPFIDAMNKKGDMTKEVTALIRGLIEDLPKSVRNGLGKKLKPGQLGGLGTPGMHMTRGSLIMLALNTGNASNLDKLIRGMGGDPKATDPTDRGGLGWAINEELLDKAFEQLTEQEWALIKGVWERADKMWPEASAIYESENGMAPPRVEPRTVNTPFGPIAGGYFPMMYDNRRPNNGKLSKQEQRTALEVMQSRVGVASVNSSMTQSRTDFAAPVLLDFEQLTRGFDNTIHFITHYNAVRNAKKILGDKKLRVVLENTVGKDYAVALDSWVAALAANGQDRPPVDWLDRLGGFMARNTTMAALGFSYTTLGAQALGLTSALDRLIADQDTYGPITMSQATLDLSHGLLMAASPENYRMILSKSKMMTDRRENFDREVQKVLRHANRRGAKWSTIKEKTIFEWGMQSLAEVQFFTVDVPTWTAAYNRALRDDAGDEARAIAYADRTVRLSQSSGNAMDLSQMHRDATGLKKLSVMFYTWFSALYGMLHEVSSEFRNNVRSMPLSAISRAATRAFVLLTLQAAGMALIRGELPDWEPEDPEEESMVEYLAWDSLRTALASLPVIRDIANGAMSEWGYSGSPLSIFGDAFSESVRSLGYFSDEDAADISDIDYTELVKRLKPLLIVTGIPFGAPVIQINRFLDGLAAFYDDAYGWHWGDLARGYNEDRAWRRAQ